MNMHLETMDVRPAHEMQKLSEAEVQAQREVERQKSEQGGSLWNHVSKPCRAPGGAVSFAGASPCATA